MRDSWDNMFEEVPASFEARMKETLSALEEKPKIRCFRFGTGALVAAALLVAVLGGTALATDFFGLKSLTVTDPNASPAAVSATAEPVSDSTVIALQGVPGSPEFKANAEWMDFLASYDTAAMAKETAACLLEKYDLYSVSTQDMANELDQITRKYNLRLHTSVTDFDSEDTLYSLLNAEPFLTDCTAVSGYIYEDGSFQPDKTVSRAEMAKMIYVLRTNGGTDATTYAVKMSTDFNDVNNHWASGYIKYCYAYGIVAGKSSTVFAPDAPVTTVEAAKMLLVYSGVDAAQSGLTGAQWKANTMKLADQDGLLKGVEADIDAPLPRQYAAQMIYNELAYSL